MEIDSYEHVLIDAHSEKIFYAPVYQEFEVKVIREKGFPIYWGKSCKENLENCITKMRQDKS